MLPDDPILAELMQTGGFETVLRIGGTTGSAALSAAALLSRFPGLSLAGATYLSNRALSALEAGIAVSNLEGSELIPYPDLPRVPSRGIPGAEPGDIVLIAKTVMPGGGNDSTDLGVDSYTVYGAPPSADELFKALRAKEEAIEKHYERLAKLRDAQESEVEHRINGAFVIE